MDPACLIIMQFDSALLERLESSVPAVPQYTLG